MWVVNRTDGIPVSSLDVLTPQRVTRVGLGIFVVLVLYHRCLRPRHVHWGATLDETRRRLPGDDDVSFPYVVTTRAVSIDARPDQIWPWLVQIGAGRGGLYSYEWLDRLFGYTTENSADEILPEFQQLAVGDVIPMGRGPSWPVVVVEPQRALVVEGVPGRVSWCFALFPTETGTRLVSRVRMRLYQRLSVWLSRPRSTCHGF